MMKPTGFSGEVLPTRNFCKYCNLKVGKQTGWALDLSSSPYAVVDFDLHGDDIEKLRSYFEGIIESANAKVVKSMSGGYHFYTLWDQSFKPTKDSYIGVYKYEEEEVGDISIDVFVPFMKEGAKSRCMMLPGSTAKNKNGDIGTYELIKQVDDEELITYSDFVQLLFDEIGFEIPALELNIDDNTDGMTNEEIDALMNDGYINELLELIGDNNDVVTNNNMTKELFSLLVVGFNKDVMIHYDGGAKSNIKLGIFHVYCALAACVNNEITNDDVDAALDIIRENCSLTMKARDNWEHQIERFKAQGCVANHPGLLYTIVKKYNPTHYDNIIKPIIARIYREKRIVELRDEFINGRYTISDFIEEMHEFKTVDDYIDNLVRCFAFIDNGKYIIKEKDEGRVKYTVINKDKLLEYINFDGLIEQKEVITEEMVEKWKEGHRKVLGEVGDTIIRKCRIRLSSIFRDVEYRTRFKRFEKVALIGDDEHVFGLYRPPRPNDYYVKIENKPELVENFLKLINDQLYDDHAKTSFEHLVYTNAYLLQQRKKSNVFFIKYGETGNSGKNYIDNTFSKLYEGFTLNGVTEKQMSEKHNGGMAGMLYRSYDEFDNSAYQDKAINNVVKRLTNDKIACRSMCADSKEVKDYSIDVLNTNDPGVYGLLKGGKALLSRLCIIRMKERDIKESEYYKYINCVDDINFPYSLYKYLMDLDLTDFIAKSKFNRYDMNETDVIAKQLLEIKRSLLDDFLDSIYDNFIRKKYNGVEVDVMTCNDFMYYYNAFMRDNKYKQSPTSLEKELLAKGFTKQRMRVGGDRDMYYYRKHINRPDDEKCDAFDDDNDEFPVKHSI